MLSQRHIARDISYSHSAKTRSGRTIIRLLENSTGRLQLIKRAQGYERDVADGKSFWSVIAKRYGLSLDLISGSLDMISKSGPLILIANHPYGILDGLMMGHILAEHRGDFKILAHQIFRKAEDLNKVILPIRFDETKEAIRQNIEVRKTALDYLANDGAIGIFPGGTVSTSAGPFTFPMDPAWRTFTARMISKSNAIVLPLFFDGHTSRLFQIASHLHYTLRMGLLLKEFKKRVDTTVRIAVGNPIGRDILNPLASDPTALIAYLREATYSLSPDGLDTQALGFEFEDHHKG